MASRSSLLVDLGATYVKVAALRPDEGIVGESNSPFPPFASLDGPYRTIDPAVLVAAVEAAIASALPLAGNPERMLLSGQMHGWTTLTDEHNVPHVPLVTWAGQSSPARAQRDSLPGATAQLAAAGDLAGRRESCAPVCR
jgi:xylulokinase